MEYMVGAYLAVLAIFGAGVVGLFAALNRATNDIEVLVNDLNVLYTEMDEETENIT